MHDGSSAGTFVRDDNLINGKKMPKKRSRCGAVKEVLIFRQHQHFSCHTSARAPKLYSVRVLGIVYFISIPPGWNRDQRT